MAIVTYATYAPEVQPYAPGCPQPVILNAFQRTANTFFMESLAYRSWVAAFDLTINVTTYTLTVPAETEVAMIKVLKCQGVDVNETTHEQFFALDPEWPTKTGTNAQYYTVLDDPSTFNIIPKPEATVASAFTAQLALAPTLTASGVEQAHFEMWKDGLIDGVLARLLKMPNTPWTNDAEAAKRQSSFIASMAMARSVANKGNISRDLTVQMRRWV
jgi:hypothetical protein